MSSKLRKRERKQTQVFSVEKRILQPSRRNHGAQPLSKTFTAASRALAWNYCFTSTALRTPRWVLKFRVCSGPLSLSTVGPMKHPAVLWVLTSPWNTQMQTGAAVTKLAASCHHCHQKCLALIEQEKKQQQETWKLENGWIKENWRGPARADSWACSGQHWRRARFSSRNPPNLKTATAVNTWK